jgi:L-malate glycosyltransferase
MNIGILCYPTFGGSGVLATELGKGLADKGHQVHFITYNIPARLDRFHENIFYHEVLVNSYPLFDYLPYETILASKVVDIVKAHHLDVIHAHYAIPHASAALMAKNILKDEGIDVKIVTTLHGTDITLVGKHPTYKPVVEYSINHSDAITAVSESLKDDTLQQFVIKKNIHVVPNFIDLSRFRKKILDNFQKTIAPMGEKILVHTSNFRKVKRVDDVIKVFSMVREQIPTKLLLIGDGPERDHMEQLCRQLDICDDVVFLGKQDNLEEILPVCDLFLLTSETESFGLAALEAMACGVPVISSNSGGIPEVNIDNETGFLHAVGDIDSMYNSALTLLQNETLLNQFKTNARKRAEVFTLERILPMYEEIYAKTLNGVSTK